jgi:hypothetical protein
MGSPSSGRRHDALETGNAMAAQELRVATAICLVSWIFSVSTARAAPKASIESGPSDAPRCEFRGDALTLTVTNQGKPVTTEHFCSSYGRAFAKVAEDRGGQAYVLLEYGEGHGTNAVTTYLTVYRLQRGYLLPVTRLLLSYPCVVSRFTYKYRLNTPQSRGRVIILRGRDDPHGDCNAPAERMRIRIEPGQ